ncbi:FIST C-terminal domain-containing protein [bacterium]|nr:FIST C-terminal domain-containing protein [bacterium]
MIRAGAGLGRGEPTGAAREAARAAVSRVEKPTGAFVFTSGLDEDELEPALAAARSELGGASVVGCSGGGVVATDSEVEGEPAVSIVAFSAPERELSFEPFLQPLAGSGARDADALAARLSGKLRGHAERSVLVLLADPLRFEGKPLLARLREKMGKLPVVGGLAATTAPAQGMPVFCEDDVSAHAASGALLSGPGLRAVVAVAQGCRPIVEAGRVTRSEKNLLLELDGKPAIERLKVAIEAAQPLGGALFCGLGLDPVAMPLAGDDYLARNILGVDPKTGAVAVAEIVPQGSTVCFLVRDAQTARDDLRARARELKAAFPRTPPAFALYFDCLGRGAGLYGEGGVDASIIREQLAVPLAGFFGNGELAPFLGTNLVHNYTGVLLLVGEPS